jgi:UDP:flavonoid glycosyltransferase YjiC (YdhE family)
VCEEFYHQLISHPALVGEGSEGRKPMHITILALGSRGDVLPFATLGKALKTAGHQVRVATFENFQPMIETHGLDFFPIRGDSQSILLSGGGETLDNAGRNVVRFWLSIMRTFGSLAKSYAQDLSSPLLRETDLIINQLPGTLYGVDLAEAFGVPMVVGAMTPLNRTRAFPMMAFPARLASIPGYNALSYRLAEQMAWQGFRPVINRWRKDTLGLSKWPFLGYFGEMEKRGVPVLNGFSPRVVPRPADWGDHIHVTGYWFPKDSDWHPPEDLWRFIENGAPPVFIGFGSMPLSDPKRATQIILDALALTGQRGILQSGWGGIGQSDLPDHVHQIDYAPHGWLFPKMAAVVGHGGSGTTASNLRAGVPSIVVPFAFDQYFWGKRVTDLGVGPPPVPYRRLSAERLGEAIDRAVNDAGMQQKATALGEDIRGEQGVKVAVEIIEKYSM